MANIKHGRPKFSVDNCASVYMLALHSPCFQRFGGADIQQAVWHPGHPAVTSPTRDLLLASAQKVGKRKSKYTAVVFGVKPLTLGTALFPTSNSAALFILAAPLLTVWLLACWYKVLKNYVHLWLPHILLPARLKCKESDLRAGTAIQSCWHWGSAALLSEPGYLSSAPCQLCSVQAGMTLLFAFAFWQNSVSQRNTWMSEVVWACNIFLWQ